MLIGAEGTELAVVVKEQKSFKVDLVVVASEQKIISIASTIIYNYIQNAKC